MWTAPIDEAAAEVADWAGGTRIGACLGTFNRVWSRRMLRRGAVVVVVSDGCDRGDAEELAMEMRWLQRRCHRLVWLNPHAGHADYAPRAAGMKAALPWIDDFLPIRDLRSMAELAETLARLRRSGRGGRAGHSSWLGIKRESDRGSDGESDATPREHAR